MSRKQVSRNHDIGRLRSLADINMHLDHNSPVETHENLKEGAVQHFSTFSCAPTRSFPNAVKRPKVYATRDFPDLCVVFASQANAKGNEDSINVAMDEHSKGVNANRVASIPTKTLRSIKIQPANSLASGSRTYDMEHKMNNAHHLNEVPPPSTTGKEEEKMAASLNSFKNPNKRLASVKSADRCDDALQGSNVEAKYNRKANDDKNKVKETLKLFREQCKELSDAYIDGTSKRRRFDLNAADLLKKQGKWINSVKGFGHIPGIAIGDQFHYRAELAVVGVHIQYMSGIDYTERNGKMLAVSIVDSGYYDNKARSVDVMIYCGQGGNKVWGSGEDQKLVRGNLALVNSSEEGNPVRVIKKKTLDSRDHIYIYDGLYLVNKYWTEKDGNGKLGYKFELIRRSSQERPNGGGESRKLSFKECCVMDDVARGKENRVIRAMNGIDGERPQAFAYTTNMRYPEWCKQIIPIPCRIGCDCTNGCSNSKQCLCVLKNGGEIQFNEKGGILRGKDIVYECGPFCKCPPSCMNRVSQHGLQFKLELYKTTEPRHVWGVRSPSYISSGSFVCEFVGDLKKIEEEGLVIDASKLGNVGRFIKNSSNSPNLLVQRILYDHEDNRVPHIMLFAAKNIRPLQGLSCDFNHHMMDQVGEFQYRLRL